MYIYSNYEISKIKESCKLVTKTFEFIKKYIQPNVTTGYIDEICNKFIIKNNGFPACLNYLGFPKSICTSVNNIVCHGIPSYNEILKNGDIINIDISIFKDGFYGDASRMFFVGDNIDILSKKLCYVTKKSLYLAIRILKDNLKINNIGKVIQNYIEKNNFSVVREYCGHGVGKNLHEKPYIYHYYTNDNTRLKEGMVITIEPMINMGNKDVIIMKDGWTVKTKDNSLSAQYEETILIKKNGYEILTK